MVACNITYYTGLVSKFVIEKFAKILVITNIDSEFRCRDWFIDENTLVILMSKFGEVIDTLASLRYAKEKVLEYYLLLIWLDFFYS